MLKYHKFNQIVILIQIYSNFKYHIKYIALKSSLPVGIWKVFYVDSEGKKNRNDNDHDVDLISNISNVLNIFNVTYIQRRPGMIMMKI